MRDMSRKRFLKHSAAATAAAGLVSGFGTQVHTASAGGPETPVTGKYDLLIKGGEVLDPSQSLRGVRDVAIDNAQVVAVETGIPEDRAEQVLPAEDKLVLPGLVDMHSHVYPQASAIGLPADELVPATGTTTFVSAGDAGANNFSGLDHWVIGQARSRIVGFLHISSIGLAGYPVGEMLNIDYGDVDLAAKTLAENTDTLIGMKVREGKDIVGDNGLEPLRRAIEAAENSETEARVMCHIGDAPGDLAELLDMLRPGDVLTHSYSGAGNNIVKDGELLSAALEAKERGVIIDVGHGGGSFSYAVAEPAIEQGLAPDTIGSDLHAISVDSPGTPYLPWVMSKFLALGFTLEEVVAKATINPAQVIRGVEGLGTLGLGAPGDVSIMDLVEGDVTFVDTEGEERTGDRHLRPATTISAGRPFGRPYPYPQPVPYPQPFTYP